MASEPAPISSSTLSLQISDNPETTLVHCNGKLTFENAEFFKHEVRSRVPNNGRLTLDLSNVTRMDSSGLGVIVGLYVAARRSNCRLELINLNKQIRDLLSMSRLLEIFETCATHNIRVS